MGLGMALQGQHSATATSDISLDPCGCGATLMGLGTALQSECPVCGAPATPAVPSYLCAHRAGELQLGQIVLDCDHARAGAHGADVEHQHLALGHLGHLRVSGRGGG